LNSGSARISAGKAARVRKLEATKAKRATKREFIVTAPGAHEGSDLRVLSSDGVFGNHNPRAKPAPRGTSKASVETTVTNGSLYSILKTQATSVLLVAREESQRLSAADFP
jgi:hypothetical protein